MKSADVRLKSPIESEAEMIQLVMPQNTNTIGTLFGGQVMSWIDICALIVAQRHCRHPVVTASIDSVHFMKPIKLGHNVILKSRLNAVFRSSMEVGTVVFAEDTLTGERFKAVRAYCTFVATSKEGQPLNVPGLLLDSEEDKRRHREAEERRTRRLLYRRFEIAHSQGDSGFKEKE